MTALFQLALRTYVGVLVIFLVVPLLVLVPMSFSAGQSLRFPPSGFSLQWYQIFFDTHRPWLNAAITSLAVALTTAVVGTVLGILGAFALVRGRFPGKSVVGLLVLSPQVVPVVVTAIGLYTVFVRMRIAGSALALVAAHTVLALPLVTLVIAASLRAIDRNLELAAMNLGAGPLQAFWRVTFPLILPGIGSAALFGFIVSWDEVVASIFLTTPTLKTLPVLMWGQIRSELDPTIAAAAVVILAVTTCILGVALLIRRQGRDSVL